MEKTNKNIYFTIGGQHTLLKAFAIVLDEQINLGFDGSFAYLLVDYHFFKTHTNPKLTQTNLKEDIHYHLPVDWDAAMDHCKKVFHKKNKDIKKGDYILYNRKKSIANYCETNEFFGRVQDITENFKLIIGFTNNAELFLQKNDYIRHLTKQEIIHFLVRQANKNGVKVGVDDFVQYSRSKDELYINDECIYKKGEWINPKPTLPFGDSSFVINKKKGVAHNAKHHVNVPADDFKIALDWIKHPPQLSGYDLKFKDLGFTSFISELSNSGMLKFGCERFTLDELEAIVEAFKT